MTTVEINDMASVNASDPEVGQFFQAVINGTASLYLVSYDSVVDIQNPNRTWCRSSAIDIESYHPIKKIIIEVAE